MSAQIATVQLRECTSWERILAACSSFTPFLAASLDSVPRSDKFSVPIMCFVPTPSLDWRLEMEVAVWPTMFCSRGRKGALYAIENMSLNWETSICQGWVADVCHVRRKETGIEIERHCFGPLCGAMYCWESTTLSPCPSVSCAKDSEPAYCN